MRPLLWLVAANLLGSSAYAVNGYALRGFEPAALVFWRFAVALLIFCPFLPAAARQLGRRPADWARVAAVGVFGFAVPMLLGAVGQGLSTATNASLFVGVEPVSIVLLSALLHGERLTPPGLAAVAAGFGGAALIAFQGLPSLGSAPGRGDALLFVHGVCWSLYTVFGKPVLSRVDPLPFTAAVTAAAFGPIAWAARGAGPVAEVGPEAWAAIAYLSLAVSFGATYAFGCALSLVSASQMAACLFLQPLFGALLGVLLHGDRLTAWTAVGGALIVLGATLATKEYGRDGAGGALGRLSSSPYGGRHSGASLPAGRQAPR